MRPHKLPYEQYHSGICTLYMLVQLWQMATESVETLQLQTDNDTILIKLNNFIRLQLGDELDYVYANVFNYLHINTTKSL